MATTYDISAGDALGVASVLMATGLAVVSLIASILTIAGASTIRAVTVQRAIRYAGGAAVLWILPLSGLFATLEWRWSWTWAVPVVFVAPIIATAIAAWRFLGVRFHKVSGDLRLIHANRLAALGLMLVMVGGAVLTVTGAYFVSHILGNPSGTPVYKDREALGFTVEVVLLLGWLMLGLLAWAMALPSRTAPQPPPSKP